MIKKLTINGIIGIVTGTFIGTILSLVFSALNSTTTYYPSSPAFVARLGGSLPAMTVSVIIWSAIGLVFSLGQLIFSVTDWGIAKSTVVHFCVTYCGFLPLAIFSGWFPLNAGYIGAFTIEFIIIYIIIYVISLTIAKKQVRAINDQLKKRLM